MKIIFATDYVCPYCIVGKAALKAAIQEMNLQVEIETHPMELTLAPAEKVDTWNDEKRKENYKVLIKPAAELGIDAKFPPYVVPRPYTTKAFEGHWYALEQGLADVYDDAMYRAYFVEERDIGELDVLMDVARKVGLDPEEFRQVLEAGTYQEKEKEEDAYTKNVLDIHSVPTLVIDGERVQFEAYTKEEAMEILKRFL